MAKITYKNLMTVAIRMDPSPSAEARLLQTRYYYHKALTYCSKAAFDAQERNAIKIHHYLTSKTCHNCGELSHLL